MGTGGSRIVVSTAESEGLAQPLIVLVPAALLSDGFGGPGNRAPAADPE